MLVKIKVSALRDTHWHEYALRFGLGGLASDSLHGSYR